MQGNMLLEKEDRASFLSIARDPAFWEKTWEEVIHTSLNARRRQDISPLDYWNRYSRQMQRRSQEDHTSRRVARVMDWLAAKSVQIGGQDILDIGAGTGAFTIPFLEQGARVTALEPAEGVMEKLVTEVENRNLHDRVTYLDTPWENLDPVAAGLTGRYDLVFASLVPGIRSVETLEQMNIASRKWCFLCAFAGKRSSTARDELWQLLLGEKMPLPEHEVIVPLNYLYACGYTPSFEVWHEVWQESHQRDDAVGGLCDYFHNFLEVTPAVEQKIVSYVDQHLQDGLFCEDYKVRLGMILWTVG